MPACRKQIDNWSKMAAPLSQKLPAIEDAAWFTLLPAMLMFCCSIHIKPGVFSKLLPSFGESDVTFWKPVSCCETLLVHGLVAVAHCKSESTMKRA